MFSPTSQPFSACNCRRGNCFTWSIPRLPFCFPLFWFCFWTCFFCAHHEGVNQAPIATVSTYHKHSRTAYNRPCTEQQSKYISIVSTRVRQRTQADRSKSNVAKSQNVRVFYFSFFPLCCCSKNAFIKPTINLIFCKHRSHPACDRPPSRLYHF